MKELHDAFKSKGVELVVVYQPTRGPVDRNKLFPAERDKFDYDKALKTIRPCSAASARWATGSLTCRR